MAISGRLRGLGLSVTDITENDVAGSIPGTIKILNAD